MTRIGDSDLDVLPLNLGGNVFGWTADRDETFAILDAFTEAGGDFVDTADSYTASAPGNKGGESETLIGEWLALHGRDALVVATKVSHHPEFLGLAPDNIRAAAEESLRRLRTDHIDLYYAHFDDPTVPVAEFAGALSDLVDAGKVRYLGISNFAPERIDEWFDVAARDGLHAPVALQPHYNLLERDVETNGLLVAAGRHGMTVAAYWALASGFLTGKYRDADVTGARAKGAGKYADAQGFALLRVLDEIAAAHDASVAAVALAWLRQRGAIPIASVSRAAQLPDLLASTTLELTGEEMARLV